MLELSRNLTTLAQQHSETVSSHNSVDHASQIVELDTQKFRIAKAASDLEIEGERLEQELESLKSRLQELDIQGVEGDETMKARQEIDDPTMLVFAIVASKLGKVLRLTAYTSDLSSKCTAHSESTWRQTMPGRTARLLLGTTKRVTFMWSTSIRSSRGFSMPTTSGRQCNLHQRRFLNGGFGVGFASS